MAQFLVLLEATPNYNATAPTSSPPTAATTPLKPAKFAAPAPPLLDVPAAPALALAPPVAVDPAPLEPDLVPMSVVRTAEVPVLEAAVALPVMAPGPCAPDAV